MTTTEQAPLSSTGFAIVPNWIMRDPTISVYAKTVYAALASYADRDGIAFPSIRTLATELGISEPTVRKAIETLETLGVVTKSKRFAHDSSKHLSNIYRIFIHAQSPLATHEPVDNSGEVVNDIDHGGQPDLPRWSTTFTTVVNDVSSNNNHLTKPLNNNTLGQPAPKPVDNSHPHEFTPHEIETIFWQFWELYPRHEKRARAYQEFKAALLRGIPPSDILTGVTRYINDPHLPPKRFIPHANNWLKAECWNDGLLPPRDDAPALVAEQQQAAERAENLKRALRGMNEIPIPQELAFLRDINLERTYRGAWRENAQVTGDAQQAHEYASAAINLHERTHIDV